MPINLTRRDFLKTAGAAATLAGSPLALAEPQSQTLEAPGADPFAIELANEALNAARSAGASYADVRVGHYRRQSVATRELKVTSVTDSESYGLGVRTLIDGCWGFAATSRMTKAGARQAALNAATMSKAARDVHKRPVELAPVKPVQGTWITPVRKDPINIALEEKVALLLATNEAALKVQGVQFVNSSVEALREIKKRSRERFRHAFEQINKNFSSLFQELFGGGRGEMSLIDADDVLESGIDVVAQPPGKRLQNVLLLSGGEKAMAALALVLGIFHYRPAPFCLLDEVDAPLDEANVGRFTDKVVQMSEDTQFIVITHNKRTMEMARALYGVTMEEAGVSKLVSVKFE